MYHRRPSRHRPVVLAQSALIAALFAPVAFSPIAVAQQGTAIGVELPGSRRIEVPIQLDHIDTMRVSSTGRVLIEPGGGGGGGYTPRRCNIVSTHTDASFTGGSYIAQAGFSENEAFAATYTLLPSDFPIKIDKAEMIFATSGATVATTTQWSILFYSGLPTTGTLVEAFNSDDIILPHIHLGPGTNGVNVEFSIDPGDPEQVFISNNGSNQFTVVWRIDQHHQQTQDPCSFAPPTCCNAFPVTDVSGLAQPTNNWLYGLNCGPFGCPANGGWARFSALPSYCRPSGDVVTRTTWSSAVTCTPGVGSCCLPSGACQVMAVQDCQTAQGTYRGDNTDCVTPCPAPTGACCFSNGFCINNLTAAQCAGAPGTWQGSGSTCSGPSSNQCPSGACCMPDGTCVDAVSSVQCAAMGGAFRGVGTLCSGQSCPQPTGACCTSTGFCLQIVQTDCLGIPGGVWNGPFTTCADGNGNGTADLCEPDCGSADFDGDGDTGTDLDIEAFFACLGGDCCAMCGSADFDTDGDTGTDLDIEAFFRVLGGGGC